LVKISDSYKIGTDIVKLVDAKNADRCKEKEIRQVEKKKAVRRNAIKGLIIPNKWDENGRIIGIAIHTDQEEVYLVAHNRMESELLNHLHMKVGIKGKIMERLDGSKLIQVNNFKPILKED
jgi:hypothetical protein